MNTKLRFAFAAAQPMILEHDAITHFDVVDHVSVIGQEPVRTTAPPPGADSVSSPLAPVPSRGAADRSDASIFSARCSTSSGAKIVFASISYSPLLNWLAM